MPTHTLAFLPIQRKVRLVSCKRNTLPLCGSVIAITERGVLNGVMKNHGTSKRIHRCRSSVKKTMVKYYRAHISLLLFLGTYYLGIDVRPCRNPMLGNLSLSNLFASDCLKFFF